MINFLKELDSVIKLFVVNVLFRYRIRSGMFGFVNIKLRCRKSGKGVNLNLFDNFGTMKITNDSIYTAYRNIDNTKLPYLRFICYKSSGFYTELTNEFVLVRNRSDRYAEISIPVKKYRKELKKLLEDIIAARKKYTDNVMADIKVDMTNDRLVMSSATRSIAVDLYHVNKSISYDQSSNYFLFSEISGIKGWYSIIPLWNYSIDYTNDRSIIVTDSQLRDNIVPPTRYFNSSIPHYAA